MRIRSPRAPSRFQAHASEEGSDVVFCRRGNTDLLSEIRRYFADSAYVLRDGFSVEQKPVVRFRARNMKALAAARKGRRKRTTSAQRQRQRRAASLLTILTSASTSSHVL